VSCVTDNGVCYNTPTVAKSGDDVLYRDLKDHLYSPVSHITFTHGPRLVGRLTKFEIAVPMSKPITVNNNNLSHSLLIVLVACCMHTSCLEGEWYGIYWLLSF